MKKEWERARRTREPILVNESKGFVSGHREFRLFMCSDVYAVLEKLAKKHDVSMDDEVQLIMLESFEKRDPKVYKEMRQYYKVMEPRLLDIFDKLSEKV